MVEKIAPEVETREMRGPKTRGGRTICIPRANVGGTGAPRGKRILTILWRFRRNFLTGRCC